MTTQRVKRVEAALKQEVSCIIHDELKDPRIGFVTVTKVQMPADLRSAKIYISILGSEKEKKDSLIGLRQASGYIRRLIGDRLKLRYTPQISFSIDKTSEYVQHIQDIIDKIHKEDEDVDKKDS
jgi:ribosome-binding factor A